MSACYGVHATVADSALQQLGRCVADAAAEPVTTSLPVPSL